MYKKVLFLLLFSPLVGISQNSLQSTLSEYYLKGEAAYKKNDYRLAMKYLDSSQLYFGHDSLELAFNLNRYALCYDRLDLFDSSMYYFNRAEPVARDISESEPLSYLLLLRGYAYRRSRDFEKSNRDLLECIDRTTISEHNGAYRLGWCYHSMSQNYLDLKKLDTAYHMISKMEEFAQLDSTKRLMPQVFSTKGKYLYLIGDLEGALANMYKKVEFTGFDINNLDVNNSSVENLNNLLDMGNIALMHQALGDFERAEEYLLAIDETYRNSHGGAVKSYYFNLLNLSSFYLEKGDYVKASKYINEHLETYRNTKASYLDAYYYKSTVVKGKIEQKLENWDTASQLYSEAIKFFSNVKDNQGYLAEIYTFHGLMQIERGAYDEALESLETVLEIQRELDDLKTQNSMFAFNNLARVYEKKGMNEKAIQYRDSALWVNHKQKAFSDISVSGISYPDHEIKILHEKLMLIKKLWQLEGDKNVLKEALETIEEANLVIDYARKFIRSDNNRLSITRDFYDLAVYFYSEKYNLTGQMDEIIQAISYAENDKSFLLNELMGEHTPKTNADLDVLINLKKEAKQLLRVYTVQEDAKNKILYYEKLDSIQRILDGFNNYNHFKKLSKQDIIELSDRSNVLSLHLGANQLYCFLIANGTLSLKRIPLDSSFINEVLNFRKELSSPEGESLNLSFANPLIEFISPYIGTKLTIIPDGILNYVPFELLSTDSTQSTFLFEKFEISYLNSVYDMIWQVDRTVVSNELLSFAPEFNSDNLLASNDVVRGELSKLPGAFEEVNILKNIFSGLTFLQKDATESNFVQNAGNYGIIHLATHAVVDDQYPEKSKLVFNIGNDTLNDGYLHAYEIYNLDLNAQLVTLSACNTGFGQIKKGEGVMSLSRAFAYAGVPATVVSLWPASDKSTPELMKYFYQNLKNGETKDMALNNARKQYLITAKGKARHPFYWGGFVLIGDNSPITSENSYVALILSFLFLLTAIPIVLVIKNKYLSID